MKEDKSNPSIDPRIVSLASTLEKLIEKQVNHWEDIVASSYDYTKALNQSVSVADKLGGQLQSMTSLSAKLTTRAQELATNDNQRVSLVKRIENVQQNALEIADEQVKAQADLLVKQTMLKTGLTGIYASQAAELLVLEKKGLLTKQEYEKEILKLKERKKVTDSYNKEVELLEEISKRTAEIKEEAHEWKKGFEGILSTSRAIASNPALIKAFLLGQAIKGVEKLTHSMHEFMEVGMTAGEAVETTFRSLSIKSVMGLSKVADVNKELASQFGNLNTLTQDQANTIGEMATGYGLAGQEALNLSMAVSRMPGESRDTAVNFKNTAESVGKMKGVMPSQIMKEMAKNTANMALYSKGGAQGFAQAAASAKKMGIELSSALSAAEKTLDFESSINAQMEASVLLGKQINLDKLRQASLSGDANAILQEQQNLMAQVGNLDNMNLLQKKALANAMGLTVEEMQKMTDEANFQSKYFGEEAGAIANATGVILKYGEGAMNVVTQFGPLIASTFMYIGQMRVLRAVQIANNIEQSKGFFLTIKDTVAKRLSSLASLFSAQAKATETASLHANTTAQNTNSVAMKTAGKSAAMGAVGMLAMGAAIAMIGGGIWLAATGLATLVASFKDLTGEQILGAVATVGILTAAFYFMIPAIAGVAATATAGAVGLLALGAAVLMIGAGIGLAALGMAQFAASLKDVPVENILAFSYGLTAMAVGMIGLAAALIMITPTIGTLMLMGVAFTLIGVGVKLAVDNLDKLVDKAEGLREVGAALGDIAKNLATIGGTGILALPVLTALTALGGTMERPAAPEAEEESKMDVLIAEIRELKQIASKGGVINLDGRKVGDVLRLSVNSSNIR